MKKLTILATLLAGLTTSSSFAGDIHKDATEDFKFLTKVDSSDNELDNYSEIKKLKDYNLTSLISMNDYKNTSDNNNHKRH